MDGEQVLGFIPDAMYKTGMFRSTAFTLVLTNQRLIAAQVSDAVKRAYEQEQKAAGTAPRFGLFARNKGTALAARYLTMNPDAIVAESPANLVFAPASVRDVVVKRGTRQRDEDTLENYLFIRLTDARGSFDYSTASETPRHAEALTLFSTLFGARTRTG